MITASAVFVFTLYLVLVRPRNIDTALAALIGALLALLLGVITLADVTTVAGIVWDATFALIGIVIISALLEGAGFFQWAALHIARLAGGDGRSIFSAVVVLGAFVSTFFTNDATVLILTPILYEMLRALGFERRAMLPYLMAAGFVADAMSIPLAVSNLTNMIVARYFHVPFAKFALLMVLPSVVTLAATLLVLRRYFRREIPAVYDAAVLPPPAAAVRDPFLFRAGVGVLGLMLLLFFLNSGFGSIPVSFVIAGGAALLLAASLRNRVVKPAAVLKEAPWHQWSSSPWACTWWSTGWAAPTMNNLPGVMLGAMAVDAAGAAGLLKDGMVLASVIGAGIGPKLTPIGSLATLIWLHYLQGKGIRISWADYLRVGLVITPPVLLAALLGLWAVLALLG